MTEKHFIPIEDNQEISAVHHKADSDKWIFFCHGFGSNKEGSYQKRCDKLGENDWNAVRFDFRGNGESDGDFVNQSLSSKINDLEAVINHFGPEKCVVFGSSFGGKVAFHASIQDHRIKSVIGKAPVTYNKIMEKYRSVVEEKGEHEHISGKKIDISFFEDFDNYSFEDVEDELDIPVLIFHGSSDNLVHIENSYKALKNLDSDVALHKLRNEKHSFSYGAEKEMQKTIVDWLS